MTADRDDSRAGPADHPHRTTPGGAGEVDGPDDPANGGAGRREGPADRPGGAAVGSAEEIDVEVAVAAWAAGDPVLDVRTPEEYTTGHVVGARNVPLARLTAVARELPAGQLITVCTSGGRSWQAAQRLAALGRTALSVRGGTKAWRAAGHPVVDGPLPGTAGRSGLLRRLLSRRR